MTVKKLHKRYVEMHGPVPLRKFARLVPEGATWLERKAGLHDKPPTNKYRAPTAKGQRRTRPNRKAGYCTPGTGFMFAK